jgi:beta-ribofuranosylaminobenzene 5'-phosphate synthase
MHEAVEVTCSARLHLGFLDLSFTLGRRFGGIGVALDGPLTSLSLARAEAPTVQGPDGARAAQFLDLICSRIGLAIPHALTIASSIPAHSGLGSGTQLALGVAAAVRKLHGLQANPGEDARVLGRGNRSGLGLFLFQHGGLVVDGGRRGDELPPLLARMAVPEDWRILLVQNPAHRALSGASESEAFTRLAPLADSLTARICRLVLMQALPAVAEADMASFGAAVAEIQAIAGEHFAAAQGGRFSSSRVAAALALARKKGATGIGQSSWGASGFAFVLGEPAAQRIAGSLREHGAGLDIRVCKALNRGASVTTKPASAR